MLAIPIESKGYNQGYDITISPPLRRKLGNYKTQWKKYLLLYLELPNGAYSCLNSRLDLSASRIHEQLLSLSPSCCDGPSSQPRLLTSMTVHFPFHTSLSRATSRNRANALFKRRSFNNRDESVLSLRFTVSRHNRDRHCVLRLTVTA